MKFTKTDLTEAGILGGLSQDQVSNLVTLLQKRQEGTSQFSLGHVLYYLGGLLIISAMSWFMVKEWETLGGGGIAAVAMAYASILYIAGATLWQKKPWKIPAGILLTAGVWMVPLIVYGIQRKTGLWLFGDPGIYRDYYHWIKGGWFAMEFFTALVGILTMCKFRFSFLMFPVAFALFFMSMDLSVIMLHEEATSWDAQRLMSMVFGLGMILASYLIDRKTKEDFAFWGYLFGTMAFWCAMTSVHSDLWFAKSIYCAINLLMIFGAVFLNRKVFAVFGAIGVFIYIGDLAANYFQHSLSFPFVLSATGAMIIIGGLCYQKYEPKLSEQLSKSLPNGLKRLRPMER